jgi:hypothetical protein
VVAVGSSQNSAVVGGLVGEIVGCVFGAECGDSTAGAVDEAEAIVKATAAVTADTRVIKNITTNPAVTHGFRALLSMIYLFL